MPMRPTSIALAFLIREKTYVSRSLFPLLSSELAHIDLSVGFVDDLETDERFDDVFEGDESAGRTEFIDNDCDVLVAGKQLVEELGETVELGNATNVAFELAERCFRSVVCQFLKEIGFEDVAGNLVLIVSVERYPRESRGLRLRSRLAAGEALGKTADYRAGRHNAFDLEIAETNQAANHARFVVCQNAFAFADVSKGNELVATDARRFMALRAEQGGDPL